MKISIRFQGLESSAEMLAYIERRLSFAVGRFATRITQVAVKITDLNGSRGGVDKRCRLLARLSGYGDLVVEDNDANLLVVIDRATERLGRVVSRRCERQRSGRDQIAFDGTHPSSREHLIGTAANLEFQLKEFDHS